jgi:cation transport ATPase
VGIALSSGASVSMEAADVTLYHPDLRLVPWLHRLARRTDRIIRQNLWWTAGYNAVGLGLAVAGLLHPLAAVVIMTGSSLLVTANALRLRRDGDAGTDSTAACFPLTIELDDPARWAHGIRAFRACLKEAA